MKKVLALCVLTLLILPGCKSTLTAIDQGQPSMDEITIAYAEAPSTYSPLSYEAKNRKYFSNLYEPLLQFDGTFNIESSLAVSWGRLDDITWDFHLRHDVYFHDGRIFSAADAVYSINLARSSTSELQPLLSTIVSVEQTEDDRISIVTSGPDPLLLNRLTYVYMIPEDTTDFSLPIGTGPYRVHEFVQDDLVLERFSDYWGPIAYFPLVHLQTIADPDERVQHLMNGDIQVLANVPPQSVSDLEGQGYNVVVFPSLEESYLVLNQSRIFQDPNLRAAVWFALSEDYATPLGGEFLQYTSQYAAAGIEGFSKDAAVRMRELEIAQEFRARIEGPVSVTLDVPEGVESLGVAIASDLEKVDIKVTVNVLPAAELQDKIISGESDFYFFGWKYDLADNADFFEAVVHSTTEKFGQFNGGGYASPDLDALIEKAAAELTLDDRRRYIQQIEDQLFRDQAIIPLFEAKTLYAFRPPLLWSLRLDGQLWAIDLNENVVE